MTKSKAQQLRDQYDGRLDPKPERGKCPVCGSKRPPIAIRHRDPFCSAGCARVWFEANGIQ